MNESLTGTQLGLIVLAILGAFLAYLAYTSFVHTADARYAATAQAMVDGSVNFAATQRATIIADVTAAGGAAVSFNNAALVAAGATDRSTPATTPTGGTWCLEFRTYGTAVVHIQGIVGAAGETAPKKPGDATLVAVTTGRPFAGTVVGGAAVGPDFSQPLGAFTGPNVCSFGAGAFVAVITDNEAIGTTNWLSRIVVPGNPSATTMSTNLSLGGNNITGVSAISASTVSTTGVAPAPGDIDAADFNATGGLTGASLALTGNGTVGGTFTSSTFVHTSDGRLKTDWRAIENPFDVLEPVRFGRFTWIRSGEEDLGVEAQSLQATLPELIHLGPDGQFGVSYDGFIPVLIAAVDQAHGEAMAAQAELKALKRRIVALVAANDNGRRLRAVARR